MKTAAIWVLVLATLTPATSIAKSTTASKSTPVVTFTAFPDGATSLPKDYQGTDPIAFLKFAEAKFKHIGKGEFDTDADVAARREALKANMAPLSMDVNYAFRMDTHIFGVSFNYDVGAQQFMPRIIGYNCVGENTFFGQVSRYRVCDVKEIEVFREKYVGSNAFGVSKEISKRRERVFSLAIKESNAMFKGFYDDYNAKREVLKIPLDRAKAIGSDNIGTLFVGSIASPELIDGQPTMIKPSMDNPQDIFVMRTAVPFDLKKVVYFVKSTGEILHAREAAVVASAQ